MLRLDRHSKHRHVLNVEKNKASRSNWFTVNRCWSFVLFRDFCSYLRSLSCFLLFTMLIFIVYYVYDCLLYTSDAADDLLCVDLGGRRIIKKNFIVVQR